jgi:hypothetical protein
MYEHEEYVEPRVHPHALRAQNSFTDICGEPPESILEYVALR